MISIDPQPTNASKIILKHAGVLDRIQLIEGTAEDQIKNLEKQLKPGSIDAVFIDHAKDYYLSDLLLLENSNLLSEGALIMADNVLVFKLQKYLDHIDNSGKYKDHEIQESLLEVRMLMILILLLSTLFHHTM
jgi:catechol O-methyltransferase